MSWITLRLQALRNGLPGFIQRLNAGFPCVHLRSFARDHWYPSVPPLVPGGFSRITTDYSPLDLSAILKQLVQPPV
jgi:hypothetical protein